MDIWHKITQFIDYNRYLVLGILLALVGSFALVGCDPKTQSIIWPEKRVTAEHLQREITTAQAAIDAQGAQIQQLTVALTSATAKTNADIQAAAADLQKQYDQRTALITAVAGIGGAIATGGLTAPVAISSIAQILLIGLAGGASIDSLRKAKVIAYLKNGGSAAAAPPTI